jgi:hypothetical protein
VRGEELYRIVEEYSALGDHRTGTEVDRATADWLMARLEDFGASDVCCEPFDFPRYDARWSVRIDGDEVTAIPLFYEGTGRVKTDAPATSTQRVLGGAALPDLQEFTAAALSQGAEAAVIATDFLGTGRLCASNREPEPGSGLPTLCVAGSLGKRIESAQLAVELEAELIPGQGCNVTARLGEGPPEQAILLTTPISGWFRCAGERGTGIAVCLAVAEALAESAPVLFFGASGHELEGLGARRYQAAGVPPAKAVFHFGASVAAGDSDGVHPPTARTRWLRPCAWAGEERRDDLERALASLGLTVRLPDDEEARRPETWIGESQLWAPLGRPLVSIAGGFPLHHAPEDLPHLATTPELLDASYGAALAAAELLAKI